MRALLTVPCEGKLEMNHSTANTNAINRKTAYMAAFILVVGPRASRALCDGMPIGVRRGRRATNRVAIIDGSDGGPSEAAVINEDSLSTAAAPVSWFSLAASCHGSRSNRASADKTLSNVPFLSAPISANKKLSYSDPSPETAAARTISVTKFGCLRPSCGPHIRQWGRAGNNGPRDYAQGLTSSRQFSFNRKRRNRLGRRRR